MARKRKYKKRKRDGEEREEREDKAEVRFDIRSDAKRSVAAIFLFATAILFVLGFFEYAGILGQHLDKYSGIIFGWGKWLLPFVLAYAGAILLRRKKTVFYVTKLAGLIIVFLSALGFFHIYFGEAELLNAAKIGSGGGYIGLGISYSLIKFTGTAAGTIILAALLLAGVIVTFNFSIIDFFHKIIDFNKKDREEEKEKSDEGNIETEKEDEKDSVSDEPDKFAIDKKEKEDASEEKKIGNNIKKIEFVGNPEEDKKELIGNDSEKLVERKKDEDENEILISSASRDWKLPPLNILGKSSRAVKELNAEDNAKIIQDTFKHFGIEVEPAETKTGPTITQYSFRPAVGVKLDRITSLSNNLALALAAPSIRIEAPIPGKALIGIEVPNKSTATVRLGNILGSNLFKEHKSKLTLALGKDVSGNYILGNLEKMPHLMIAGATGAGKSVCINSIIISLLYQNSPEDLRLLLIDPKRVELSLYNGIPHLASDNVVVENGQVINSLKWAVREMEARYRLFQEIGSRDLASYNQKTDNGKKRKYVDPETGEEKEEDLKKLPFVVIIIDELADLMASHGKEVEGAIIRLAQMARAVGIHLIVSTQRPSVEVLTGLIKANITTRIAFQVATQIDSRTILGMAGAEKLLGNGDMLFLSADSAKAKRLQGVYVSEAEAKKVVKFIKKQNSKRESTDSGFNSVSEENNQGMGKSGDESFQQKVDFDSAPLGESGQEDILYEEAKNEIIKAGKASSSFLQRRFRIGYARAARIIDALEENGTVSPADGSKPRKVLIGKTSNNSDPDYEDPIKDQEQRDKWQA
ncbi:DNA translocase FtsK 4TM domain-containing protein [bacterium]|nr:DNA translocase FtsK 4TM domain-containing protein [bacterium]